MINLCACIYSTCLPIWAWLDNSWQRSWVPSDHCTNFETTAGHAQHRQRRGLWLQQLSACCIVPYRNNGFSIGKTWVDTRHLWKIQPKASRITGSNKAWTFSPLMTCVCQKRHGHAFHRRQSTYAQLLPRNFFPFVAGVALLVPSAFGCFTSTVQMRLFTSKAKTDLSPPGLNIRIQTLPPLHRCLRRSLAPSPGQFDVIPAFAMFVWPIDMSFQARLFVGPTWRPYRRLQPMIGSSSPPPPNDVYT